MSGIMYPADITFRTLNLKRAMLDITRNGMFGGKADPFKVFVPGLFSASAEVKGEIDWTLVESSEFATTQEALDDLWAKARKKPKRKTRVALPRRTRSTKREIVK